ncbi:unnamed protein product [Euphydryas editha]|uniref:DUF5641 domain-containing protein n=1 Tax=Euphydryas editha TaxID=104508 RepID=A0AAU9UCG9_EUPED|nr:unnamed protein product [Euphydryas editha]
MRRKIIRYVSSSYDPLGWVTPSIMTARVMIQKLWLTGYTWYKEAPSGFLSKWTRYREALVSGVPHQIPLPVSVGSSINGDIVVVKKDCLPLCKWIYGKIIDTHPGLGRFVRVFTV